jgi:hypothetical protein
MVYFIDGENRFLVSYEDSIYIIATDDQCYFVHPRGQIITIIAILTLIALNSKLCIMPPARHISKIPCGSTASRFKSVAARSPPPWIGQVRRKSAFDQLNNMLANIG